MGVEEREWAAVSNTGVQREILTGYAGLAWVSAAWKETFLYLAFLY